MTGSSTRPTSLSVVQHDAAASLGLPRTLIVALQNAGGGLGNMVLCSTSPRLAALSLQPRAACSGACWPPRPSWRHWSA